MTLAGVAGIGAIGALVGGWSSAMVGASLPDPVRRQFEDEIAPGRILVLVDVADGREPAVREAMAAADAPRLHYDAPLGAA